MLLLLLPAAIPQKQCPKQQCFVIWGTNWGTAQSARGRNAVLRSTHPVLLCRMQNQGQQPFPTFLSSPASNSCWPLRWALTSQLKWPQRGAANGLNWKNPKEEAPSRPDQNNPKRGSEWPRPQKHKQGQQAVPVGWE